MVQCRRASATGAPSASSSHRATAAAVTIPGATGATTIVADDDADADDDAAAPSSPPASTYRSPPTSDSDTGCSRPPMDDSPMPAGSARVRNTSYTVSRSQIARVATNRSREIATSTSAKSRYSPFTRMCSALLTTAAYGSPSCRDATSPAAIPASVPSIITGNTLFVPVEIATIGSRLVAAATARFVPSPPSVIRHPTPCSAIIAAARRVSPSV